MGVQIPRCFEARAHLKVNWELLDPRVQGRYQSFDSTTVLYTVCCTQDGDRHSSAVGAFRECLRERFTHRNIDPEIVRSRRRSSQANRSTGSRRSSSDWINSIAIHMISTHGCPIQARFPLVFTTGFSLKTITDLQTQISQRPDSEENMEEGP